MDTPLEYQRATTPHVSLRAPFLIALIGCPASCAIAAIFGVAMGSGISPLPPGDIFECVVIGAAIGIIGAALTIAFVCAFPRRSLEIGIGGVILVAVVVGLLAMIVGVISRAW